MKSSKKITLQGEEVEITKIPIGKFAELMMAIENLPSLLLNVISTDEMENLDNQVVLAKLPHLLANAQDEVFKFVSIASGVENIEELDVEEFLDLVTAVVEINNINAIVSKVKNLGKVLQAKIK